MPIISDISHSIATTDTYSHDLEVQWSPLNFGQAVKVLSFDRLGRFCAIYTEDRTIRLCDVRSALLPMTLLPLNNSINRYEAQCLAMAWSQCGHFLAASFSKQYSKRKFNVEHSSMVFLWHIPSQRIVYKISVPITASFLHIAPSSDLLHPSFIISSQHSPFILVLDAFHGSITTIEDCKQISHQVPAAVLPTPDSPEVDTITFAFTFTTDISNTSNLGVDGSMKEDTTEYRTVCQYLCDETDASLVRGSRLVRCRYSEIHQVCSLSTIDFTLSNVQGLAIANNIDTAVITNVQRVHQISLNQDQSKLLVAIVDRVFVFSISKLGNGYLHEEQINAATCNMLTQIHYSGSCAFQSIAEFYGFPRNSRLISINFFSRKFDVDRRQEENSCESIMIITSHQVDRLHTSSELLLWDYLLQEKVVNNKLITAFSKSNNVVVLPNALICSELFIQPVISSQHALQRQKPQALFALDADNKLWNSTNMYWSKFPGPMYPIGYTLIQQVKPYIETEEELDTKIIPSKKALVVKHEKIRGEKLSESVRALPLSCISTTISKEYSNYLQKLPFSLEAFIAKNSNKRQSTAIENITSPTGKHADEMLSPGLSPQKESILKNLAFDIGSEAMDLEGGRVIDSVEEGLSITTSDAKREVFSSSLKSYLPIPTRVLAGDFELKVQRDRALNDAIRAAVADASLAAEKMQQLKQEALRHAVKKCIGKESRRIHTEEKKKQRIQKKDELLKSIFSVAIEREQEEALRRDVKKVIDKMIRALENQSHALHLMAVQSSQYPSYVAQISTHVMNSPVNQSATMQKIIPNIVQQPSEAEVIVVKEEKEQIKGIEIEASSVKDSHAPINQN